MSAREIISKTFDAEMRAWFIGEPFPDPGVSADAILAALRSAGWAVVKVPRAYCPSCLNELKAAQEDSRE